MPTRSATAIAHTQHEHVMQKTAKSSESITSITFFQNKHIIICSLI